MNVISGCASLGVDVPMSIYQALVDQHGHSTVGEYLYSAIAADPQYTLESQYLATDGAMADWSYGKSGTDNEHAWRIEGLHGDLAGTGSQFDASLIGHTAFTREMEATC